MDSESSEAVLVLADELEERGDPRAELVRAQLHGRDHGELLRTHWREWVGDLEPESALLRWKWGHLIEVGVSAAPARLDAGGPALEADSKSSSRGSRWARGAESRVAELSEGCATLICFQGRSSRTRSRWSRPCRWTSTARAPSAFPHWSLRG